MAGKNTAVLAPHEMLELHETMHNDLTVLKKLQTSLPMVQDAELQGFMQDALRLKKAALHQAEQLYIKMEHNRLQ